MKTKSWLFLLIGVLLPALVFAQEEEITSVEDTLTVSEDIFELSDPMVFTLVFDIKEYQKTKYKGENMSAELTYHINDSTEVTKSIKIKARGAFRRQHCSLPPFWINIKKAGIENEHLQATKKIKLVNHCKGSKAYNNYVLKEYLAYKIYNIISPYSFRVSLVKVKYIDSGRKNKETSGWAFMIEPEAMMAERLNAFPFKYDKISHTLTDTLATDMVAVYQYMIGNGDYSITGRHNVKLLKINDFTKPHPIPVPYDFDYSGLVNTYYAIPGEELGLESVTERYFLGVCRTSEQYLSVLEIYKEKKDEIYSFIDAFPYLDEASKKEMISYLDEFFSSIGLSNFIDMNFNKTCR